VFLQRRAKARTPNPSTSTFWDGLSGQFKFDVASVLRRLEVGERRFGGAAQHFAVEREFRLVARARERRLRVAVCPLNDAALVRANRRHRALFARLGVIEQSLPPVGKREGNRFARLGNLCARERKTCALRFGLQLRVRIFAATSQNSDAQRGGGAFEKRATRNRGVHRKKEYLLKTHCPRATSHFLEKSVGKRIALVCPHVHHIPL